MKFVYKIFRQGNDILLAISDADIVGRTFEEDDLCITVLKSFYSGKGCNKKAALELIKEATIVNAVGHEIISLMLEKNLLDKDRILTISDVPHAQIIVTKS